MKINIAKSAGFCFGVRRALDIAKAAAKTEKRSVMLGDIVHNEYVVEEIKKLGIKKIKRLNKNKGSTLIIRAHGASSVVYEKALKFGYKIIDATCPMVKEIHKIAKTKESENCTIIIIGDKKHDEVNGILGHLKTKGIVIEDEADIPLKKLKGIKRACVVVQSTQELDKVEKIAGILKKHIKKLEFFNTICNPTRIKQRELQSLPGSNDVVLIIGSKTSANTRRLYEISKRLNKRSFWVESEKDIKSSWFKDAGSVGITAGASTPDFITKRVISRVKKLA